MINSYRSYVTIPNLITLSRFFLIPVYVVFVYCALMADYPFVYVGVCISLLMYATIRMTDALDGWVARLTNSTSVLGSYLDVWSDFILVLCSFLVLNFMNIVPVWLTILTVYKFFEFLILSKIIKKHFINHNVVLCYDIPSRVAVKCFFALPNIILLFKLFCVNFSLLNIVFCTVLTFTILSSAIKYYKTIRVIKNKNFANVCNDGHGKITI